MRPLKHNLFRQLISIGIIIFGVMFIGLGLLLPKVLSPIYEKNIYNYLKQPLDLINNKVNYSNVVNDVAYLYLNKGGDMFISDNLEYIIDASPKQILDKIDSIFGKFKHTGKTYYYYTSYSDSVNKVALTDSTYIDGLKKDVLNTIFPILFITFVIISALIIIWARVLVLKIQYLKEKVDNIDDTNYEFPYKFKADDELSVLSTAIDNMHYTLKEQEEFKNQMYQNISHDFKTPLTVIKSYYEAINDGVLDRDKGEIIIEEQLNKLENKVQSLLYLNKLNYIQEYSEYQNEKIDITTILNSSIEKFKFERPDITWEIKINDKNTYFIGTTDMWEAIIDNMFHNFIRYADNEIKITIKNNRITFYNDGPSIDESIIYDLFTPYKKGIKGQFGLGLSIIKKTLCLVGYEINIKNEKKGVSFIIN